RIFSAEMQIQTHSRSVVIDRGRVHLQRAHVLAPGLRAHVGDLSPRAGDEVVDPAGKAWRLLITRTEVFYHRDLRQFISDQKQMRKYRHIFAAQPMEDLN